MNERHRQIQDVYREQLSRDAPIDPRRDEVGRRLLRAAPADRSARVLDAGCGAGRYADALVAAGYTDVTAVDLLRHASIHPLRAFRFARADIAALPFVDASFDLVYSCSVIYYAADPRLAIRELGRVLVPGGVLLMTGHTRYSVHTLDRVVRRALGSRSVAHLVHARFRPTSYYRSALEDAGFEVLEQDGYRVLPARIDSVLGRLRLGERLPTNAWLRALRSHIGYHFVFVARRKPDVVRGTHAPEEIPRR